MMVTGAGGVRLAVRTAGDPALPTLVCVHGYPDSAAMWDELAAVLADRFHVVSYDVRGFGGSDRPRGRRAYRLDVLEADFHAVLDAVSPDRPVHLLGHDWGAIQGWHFVTSERLAGRVATFTSISGPCLDHAGYRLRHRPPGPSIGQVSKSWYIAAFQLPVLPELVMRTVGRVVVRRLADRPVASTRPSSADIDDYVSGIQLYRANMVPRLLHPQERVATIPVQVIAPTGDRYVHPRLQTEVSRWAPLLTVHTVEGGHWLPRTHARQLAELVVAHTATVAAP